MDTHGIDIASVTAFWRGEFAPYDQPRLIKIPDHDSAVLVLHPFRMHCSAAEARHLANELTRLASELVSMLDDRSNNQE